MIYSLKNLGNYFWQFWHSREIQKNFRDFFYLEWKFSIGCTNSFQKFNIFLRILNNASRVLFKQINLD